MNILVVCTGGISTSFLVQKMRHAMEEKGIQGSVLACAVNAIYDHIKIYDVVLLAPQAQYALEDINKLCQEKGKIYGSIEPSIYGMMNGEKVVEYALSLFQGKEE